MYLQITCIQCWCFAPVRKMCQRAFQRKERPMRPAGSVPHDPEPMVSLPSAPAVLLATSVQWGKWHSVSTVRYARKTVEAMIISSQDLYLESRSWSQQTSWACPSLNSHVRGEPSAPSLPTSQPVRSLQSPGTETPGQQWACLPKAPSQNMLVR